MSLLNYFATLNPVAFTNALPGNIAQGLIWGIMALGVYITFRLLDFADLTVDGSFATGGAVTVMMTINGHSIWVSLLCACIAGLLAGLCTGLVTYQAWYSTDPCRYPDTDRAVFDQPEYHGSSCKPGTQY